MQNESEQGELQSLMVTKQGGLEDTQMAKTFAVHPGQVLLSEFTEPLGLTAYRLGKEIDVPVSQLRNRYDLAEAAKDKSMAKVKQRAA